MLSYGFFNSVNKDRLYNAESFNKFFEGLISSNGVFENVGDGFSVTANTGLSVNVNTGKALVNYRWIKSDAAEVLQLESAHALLNRWDMITLRWGEVPRMITLELTTGTPATSPAKPKPLRTVATHEIVLAYVYVAAGATTITQANITDTRYDTELCGIIHGLIDQVDTSTLYNQYLAKFEEVLEDTKTWDTEHRAASEAWETDRRNDIVNWENSQKDQFTSWQTSQKQGFDSWFSTLTSQLDVTTHVTRKQANYQVTTEKWYIQIPDELSYDINDIMDVYLNGVLQIKGIDYTIQENEVEGGYMVKFTNDLQATTDSKLVHFIITAYEIGWTSITDNGDILTDNGYILR